MSDAAPLTDEQFLQLVQEALVSLRDSHVRLDRLSMDATLNSLGVDSMGAIEMAAYLEDKFGVRFPDDQLAKVSSVGDLAGLIRRQLQQAA